MDFKNTTFGIVGYGVEGKSTEQWLKKNSAKNIFIFDTAKENTTPWEKIQECHVVFRSPGVHPKTIQKYISADWSGTITSITDYFLNNSPTKYTIGITGTKGKGTTSTLIANILEKNGKKVYLAGNIGVPIFDFYDAITQDDFVVLELSSFQLYDVKNSPAYSVLLRTDTEHLDWHKDTQDYRNAKKNIFAFHTSENILVYFGNSSIVEEMVFSASSQKISVLSQKEPKNIIWSKDNFVIYNNIKTTIQRSDIALRGNFQEENVLATIAIAKQFNVPDKTIIEVLQTFTGLAMRLEKIHEKNGKTYFNDSFSTIPETTISALSTFSNPVYLILGGSEKNSDFSELAKICAVHPFLEKIYLIGITAYRIEDQLKHYGYHRYVHVSNLQSIVDDFTKNAPINASLLLSPACASFGMFTNYKQRGEEFVNIVKNI